MSNKSLATTLPIDSLTFDPRLQMRRVPAGAVNGVVSSEHADSIAQAVKDRSISPKVRARIWRVEGLGDLVTDGHHFIEGHRRAGKKMVPALLFVGTWEEALMDAASANPHESSPLKLTRADKENAVCAMLRTFPKMSARNIAELTRTSDFMVRQWKERLIELKEIEATETVEGKDGKEHKPAHSGSAVKETRSAPTKKRKKAKSAADRFDFKGFDARIGWIVRSIDALEELSKPSFIQAEIKSPFHAALERNLEAIQQTMKEWKKAIAEAEKEAKKQTA